MDVNLPGLCFTDVCVYAMFETFRIDISTISLDDQPWIPGNVLMNTPHNYQVHILPEWYNLHTC